MQPFNLKGKLPALAVQQIEVDFVPSGSGSQFGSRELGKWTEVYPIDDETDGIEKKQHCQEDGGIEGAEQLAHVGLQAIAYVHTANSTLSGRPKLCSIPLGFEIGTRR